MTWSDPIVEEVRRVRDAYAARFQYDLRAMYRDLKEKEKQSGRKIVSYARETPTRAADSRAAHEAPADVDAEVRRAG